MGEIVYVTTREEIEKQDISRMLSNFGPQQSKQKLRQLHGRIIFTVDGYDTAGDIFDIPEVRKYYSLVHRTWPSWLFSSCLASPSLRVIALAVIPNMSIIHSGNLCRIQIPECQKDWRNSRRYEPRDPDFRGTMCCGSDAAGVISAANGIYYCIRPMI